MYRIKLTKQARKELRAVTIVYASAISIALVAIQQDPLSGKSLTRELTGHFSYRVGAYRIIYKINKRDKTVVFILSAGHRATVYQ